MNIPGKLREDLKRIYGVADPLNYIEDARAETNPDTQQEEIIVRLRVPRHCEKYMDQLFANPFPTSTETDYIRRLVETEFYPPRFFGVSTGAQKAPEGESVEFKTGKAIPVEFPKPERILFSGPYTHVFWPDGSMTSVRLGEGEEYDEYTAFCAAVVKKMFGATHKAKKFLEKVKVIQKKKVKKSKEASDNV